MKPGKTVWIVLAVIVVLLVAAPIFLYLSAGKLARSLASERYPGLSIGDVQVGWNKLGVSDLKYRSPQLGRDVLTADTVQVHPHMLSFLGETIEISSLVINKPDVYLERRSNGTLVLPFPGAQTPARGTAKQANEKKIVLNLLSIQDGSGTFLDRSVGSPPARFQMRNVDLEVRDIQYPELSDTMPLQLSLQLLGSRPAELKADGWVRPRDHSSDLEVQLDGLFLPDAEPYLRAHGGSSGLKDGVLGLKAQLQMEQGAYQLKGNLDLDKLDFADSQGSFMGIPVQALKTYLASRDNHLEIPVEIRGDLRHNPNYTGQLVAALAQGLLKEVGTGGVKQILNDLKKGKLDNLKDIFKKKKP